MLTYLSINNPYRVLIVGFILLGLIIPLMIQMPLMNAELHYMLLAERTVHGFLPYAETIDSTSPCSLLVYVGMYTVVGKALFFYRLGAFFLILIQVFYLNKIFSTNDFFLSKTNIGALVTALLYASFFGLIYLSPVLIALTFIIIFLGYLLKVQLLPLTDQQVYMSGIYLALSVLCYLPCIVFGIYFIWILATSSFINRRRFVLALVGFLLPLLVVGIVLFVINILDDYVYLIWRTLFLSSSTEIDFRDLFILFFIPLIFFGIALVRVLISRRYVSNQQKIQWLMFFYILVTCFCFLFYVEFWLPNLLLLIPAFAFFTTHYFMLFKNKLIANFTFYIFFLFIPLFNYGFTKGFFLKNGTQRDIFVGPSPWSVSGKKVLVLGDDKRYYQSNTLATPYLNYSASLYYLNRLDRYQIVVQVFDHFQRDLPDYIVDLDNQMSSLFTFIPFLATIYSSEDGKLYKLKK